MLNKLLVTLSSFMLSACLATDMGVRTVAEVQARHSLDMEKAYKPLSDAAGIAWPPERLTVVALKQEKRLEVWVAGKSGAFAKIGEHPILAASGKLGPKRREGDKQVPEGVYRLGYLNPNSRYHLSIFVDYPNATDLKNSRLPRSQMGGLIFVHGKAVSIGCIAIGDKAIERLFCLAAIVKPEKREIIICPVDFRKQPDFRIHGEEPWVAKLYSDLAKKLSEFVNRKQ